MDAFFGVLLTIIAMAIAAATGWIVGKSRNNGSVEKEEAEKDEAERLANLTPVEHVADLNNADDVRGVIDEGRGRLADSARSILQRFGRSGAGVGFNSNGKQRDRNNSE
jgi:hypothetical protein